MCRNIRPLNNFEPPATSQEVHDAALAVREIAHVTEHLLEDLVTIAPPKNREEETAKRRARAQARYAS